MANIPPRAHIPVTRRALLSSNSRAYMHLRFQRFSLAAASASPRAAGAECTEIKLRRRRWFASVIGRPENEQVESELLLRRRRRVRQPPRPLLRERASERSEQRVARNRLFWNFNRPRSRLSKKERERERATVAFSTEQRARNIERGEDLGAAILQRAFGESSMVWFMEGGFFFNCLGTLLDLLRGIRFLEYVESNTGAQSLVSYLTVQCRNCWQKNQAYCTNVGQ